MWAFLNSHPKQSLTPGGGTSACTVGVMVVEVIHSPYKFVTSYAMAIAKPVA